MKTNIVFNAVKLGLASAILFLMACQGNKENSEQTQEKTYVKAPDFSADSAYAYIQKQVDFGPRVPGSSAHKACGNYLVEKLKSYGWIVTEQIASARCYDDKNYPIRNIIASWKPNLGNRVLLSSHWDCRPISDHDSTDTNKPIDGANDGASGVGVLLEVARLLNINKAELGVDIIFFDLEDNGPPEDHPKGNTRNDFWCLGSQYWANNPHHRSYSASYGILLDMVGAKGALFPKEGTSLVFAQTIVDNVWNTAARVGYGAFFSSQTTGQTVDDHLYVNQIARIPMIDIVHMNPTEGGYFPFHHKKGDNMSCIDKGTLKAVGQTVMEVIYN